MVNFGIGVASPIVHALGTEVEEVKAFGSRSALPDMDSEDRAVLSRQFRGRGDCPVPGDHIARSGKWSRLPLRSVSSARSGVHRGASRALGEAAKHRCSNRLLCVGWGNETLDIPFHLYQRCFLDYASPSRKRGGISFTDVFGISYSVVGLSRAKGAACRVRTRSSD